jgi:hypothetical protein
MACNCGRTRSGARSTSQPDTTKAVTAGSAVTHEVLTASGASTGRKFQSLISANAYAQRIGGKVRAVTR